MNEEDLQELFDAQERRMRATSCAFHRSIYPEIDWNDRLLCINGPKGTGKTTMMHALVRRPDAGTLRETFFRNQLAAAGHALAYPAAGDFLVDGKWTFEVGGPGKTFGQIAGLPRSYLAVDDLEVGRGNRIPLWMFGLLY